jgi:flagellin-like hook-associated protein FlgL
MASIPSNMTRVPTMLFMQLSASRIGRTQADMFRVQTQLSTGQAINRPSDDAVKAATVSVLDERLEHNQQRLRNLDHAGSSLAAIDDALGQASDLVLQAKQIAMAQANFDSDADQRSGQALIVDSLIQSLTGLANTQSVAGYIFGGSSAERQPLDEFNGGYRFRGEGRGLLTDTGLPVVLTLGANDAMGDTSARVAGSVDLDPILTGDTRLSDLGGARGMGVTLGPIRFSYDGGPYTTVDLSGADTVQDVADTLTAAITQYEEDEGVSILGSGGVSFSGGAFSIDVLPGSGLTEPTLQFYEVGDGVTGRDQGLTDEPPFAFSASSPVGRDLHPKLTWLTPVSALAGVAGDLGSIRITNNGHTAIIDLSGAQSLQDVRNLIEQPDLGVRVEINDAGTGINIINEVSAGIAGAMSIEEVAGSDLTATRLGIRSLSADTRLDVFNDGRGVDIITGSVDPVTGLPDPSRDVDFTITLGDGREIGVNLRPEDIITVQTLLARINAEAASQGVTVPDEFEAGLSDGANGIVLSQDSSLGGAITVSRANNSTAFAQLGFADGSYDATSATFTTEDRAKVRVDNVLTRLIDLRDALRADDTSGIVLAGERLEGSVTYVARTRALVGGYAQRVEAASRHEEDQAVLNETLRSELRDTDFAAAATRLSMLQTQLQAGLQSTVIASQRSLLDFLG